MMIWMKTTLCARGKISEPFKPSREKRWRSMSVLLPAPNSFTHSYISIPTTKTSSTNNVPNIWGCRVRQNFLIVLSPTLSTCQSLIRSLFFLFSFFPLTTHIVPVVVHTHSHFLSPPTFEPSEQILRISSSSSEFFFALLEREREKKRRISAHVFTKRHQLEKGVCGWLVVFHSFHLSTLSSLLPSTNFLGNL